MLSTSFLDNVKCKPKSWLEVNLNSDYENYVANIIRMSSIFDRTWNDFSVYRISKYTYSYKLLHGHIWIEQFFFEQRSRSFITVTFLSSTTLSARACLSLFIHLFVCPVVCLCLYLSRSFSIPPSLSPHLSFHRSLVCTVPYVIPSTYVRPPNFFFY